VPGDISVSAINEGGLGSRQFWRATLDGEPIDHTRQRSARGLAAKLEKVERSTQFEEGRALAVGQFEGGGDVGLAGIGVGVGVGT
jgi:hypothetical protein